MKVKISIHYYIEMPFKRKPKDEDDDDNGTEGTKPKIIRGLGGGADCKSWGWATLYNKQRIL